MSYSQLIIKKVLSSSSFFVALSLISVYLLRF
jgi:hypothetical protein